MTAAAESEMQRQLIATTRLLAEFEIKYVDRGRRIEELQQQIAALGLGECRGTAGAIPAPCFGTLAGRFRSAGSAGARVANHFRPRDVHPIRPLSIFGEFIRLGVLEEARLRQ